MDGRNALRRMGSGSALRLVGLVLVQADREKMSRLGTSFSHGLDRRPPRVPAGVGRAASAPRISPRSIDAAANGLDTNTELCGNGSQASPASEASPIGARRAGRTGG